MDLIPRFPCREIGCQVEGSREETLPEDEQKEIRKTLVGCIPQVDDYDDPLGSMAVLEPGTSFTN